MNQNPPDIKVTISIPFYALADVLTLISQHSEAYIVEEAEMPVETPLERAMRDGGDEWRDSAVIGTRHDPSVLAPLTGRCGTCAAAYRWFPGEPRPRCACGGEVIDADIPEPAPLGDVPGDIPFGPDHIDSGVGDLDAVARNEDPDYLDTDTVAAQADAFALWLEQRDHISVAAVAAFDAQDTSGNWKQYLLAAGFEEWPDGTWHKAAK